METLDANDPAREKFLKLAENFGGVLANCYEGDQAEPHAVFSHGDCWVNNVMFRENEIIFIDWQNSRYCSPADDLTYFIFICTDKNLREKHFDDLIKIYHQSLSEFLIRLGGDAETQFPFATLLEHLKRFGKSGIISGCCAIPLLYPKRCDMEKIAEKLQNIDPQEIDKLLDAYKELNKDIIDDINERILDIVHDGIKFDYL